MINKQGIIIEMKKRIRKKISRGQKFYPALFESQNELLDEIAKMNQSVFHAADEISFWSHAKLFEEFGIEVKEDES